MKFSISMMIRRRNSLYSILPCSSISPLPYHPPPSHFHHFALPYAFLFPSCHSILPLPVHASHHFLPQTPSLYLNILFLNPPPPPPHSVLIFPLPSPSPSSPSSPSPPPPPLPLPSLPFPPPPPLPQVPEQLRFSYLCIIKELKDRAILSPTVICCLSHIITLFFYFSLFFFRLFNLIFFFVFFQFNFFKYKMMFIFFTEK